MNEMRNSWLGILLNTKFENYQFTYLFLYLLSLKNQNFYSLNQEFGIKSSIIFQKIFTQCTVQTFSSFIIIYLYLKKSNSLMNSDQTKKRRSLRAQRIPIIDIDAQEHTEKQQLRKSKRIAKMKSKKDLVNQKSENLPQKKQKINKRKMKRVKSTIDLTLNQQKEQQRQLIGPKRKNIKKNKNLKTKKRAQRQSLNLVSLNSEQNANRPQVDRVGGRTVQRSRRLPASDRNISRRDRRREQPQSTNVLFEQMRENLHTRRSSRFTWIINSSQSQSEYDGFVHSSQIRRLERVNRSRQNAVQANPIPSNRASDNNLQVKKDQEKENLNWFISKNKIFNITQLSQQQIDKCDKCIICYTQWINSEQLKQQRIESQLEESKPLLQIEESNQKQKIQNQNQKIYISKENDQHLLMELFCEHLYHKPCIENWFKTNKICPCCRKDFRKHEAYKQWDTNYEKRIKTERWGNPFRFSNWLITPSQFSNSRQSNQIQMERLRMINPFERILYIPVEPMGGMQLREFIFEDILPHDHGLFNSSNLRSQGQRQFLRLDNSQLLYTVENNQLERDNPSPNYQN